jgi:FkbM family methyltransferase
MMVAAAAFMLLAARSGSAPTQSIAAASVEPVVSRQRKSTGSAAVSVSSSSSRKNAAPPSVPAVQCDKMFTSAVQAARGLHGEFLMMNPVLQKLKAANMTCGGVFVELGANDGINSHSKFLESELGWRGVCIEAAPHNYDTLLASRPLCDNINAVVWHKSEEVTFRACTGKLFGHSGLVNMRSEAEWKGLMHAHKNKFTCKDHTVNARTGADLLAGYPTIDWFFLDVEGAEMLILDAWDWSNGATTVNRWSIESNKLDRPALVDFMKAKGYDCVHIDKINTFCELATLTASK